MDPMTMIALGGLALSGYNTFFGGGSQENQGMQQIETMTPEQKQVLSQTLNQLKGMQGGLSQGTGLLQQYMNPNSDVYKNFEAPYMQQFNQQTIPKLAEQFGGLGANSGALSSSGFGQALSAAGANLQTDLAAMKSGMQRNAINDYLQLYQSLNAQGLNAQPFGYHYQDQGVNPNTAFAQGVAKAIPDFMAAWNQPSNSGQQSYQPKYQMSNDIAQQMQMGYMPIT